MELFRLKLQHYIYIFSFIMMLYNIMFCKNLYAVTESIFPTIVVLLCVWIIFNILLTLIFWKRTTKIISLVLLLINTICLYFMQTYNISIDYIMLLNAINTDTHEVAALMNVKMLLFFIFSFILPAILVCKTQIIFPENITNTIKIKIINCIINTMFLVLIIAPIYKIADDFYREQKHLRYYLLPTNYIGAVISFTKRLRFSSHKKITIGDDVRIEKYWNNDKKNLIVLVVGESARAANFSLGGYHRNTNEILYPYKDDFVYFSNAYSCGTATIISVPCIFSHKARKHFSPGSELYTENLTDVMEKANYFTLWRENNTSCQNVCNRIKTEKI